MTIFTAAIIVIVIAVLIVGIAGTSLGMHSLLLKKKGNLIGQVTWKDKGLTPSGEKEFTPQGMTWVNGKIIFANSWDDTKSRVYEIDPLTMEIKRFFDMPEGAVHTSGLAWDGSYLWTSDEYVFRFFKGSLK